MLTGVLAPPPAAAVSDSLALAPLTALAHRLAADGWADAWTVLLSVVALSVAVQSLWDSRRRGSRRAP